MSIFTEDAVIMAPDGEAIIGKEELRPIIVGLFGAFDLQLPYTRDEIGVSGGQAFARSGFQYTMTQKDGEYTNTTAGKELDIFKRQADGSWKIYIQCWNFNASQVIE